MNGEPKKSLKPRDWLFLAVFAVTITIGVRLLLSSFRKPTPVVYDESVLSEEDPYIADVRALTQLVRQRFAYVEHRREIDDLDLDEVEAAALADLGSASSDASFRLAMRRYVAALHDGHASVAFEEYRLPSDRHWPFTVLLVAEGVMVDGVHPDVADVLARGDILLSVDGVVIDRCIAEVAREIPASTDAARRRLALEWLTNWSRESELRLRLARPGGDEYEVDVPCPLRRLEIPKPGSLPTDREARTLEERIAYFRPGDFAAPPNSGFQDASPKERDEILRESYDELEQTFTELAGARAWILDLRGNPGGTDLLGQALVARLMEEGHTYNALSSRVRGGWSAPSPTIYADSRPESAFLGKLVCLIDAGTFSAADNVAACLDDLHPDVTFVGETTGAGTGAPRTFTLPRTRTRVTFSTMRVYSPNENLIEGIGVSPDRKVIRTRDDVLAGRDSAMEVALELLEE